MEKHDRQHSVAEYMMMMMIMMMMMMMMMKMIMIMMMVVETSETERKRQTDRREIERQIEKARESYKETGPTMKRQK